MVFDKLLAPSPYVDKPMPGLAESATQVDSLTWVVKLRDGVTWHDGKPFTAADVVFTYTSFRDGSPNRWTHHVNDVPKIDQIAAEDVRTVKFTCNYPCPSLGTVTFADLPILPKHIWENVKEPQTYKELPIGTGPYKLVQTTRSRSSSSSSTSTSRRSTTRSSGAARRSASSASPGRARRR